MPTRAGMIRAVFKRNFFAYFINPTGYVFITVFIFLGAMAAFWPSAFFMNNLANLDQLNAFFPYLLLFFVPALTMNVWSEERRQGTDELLLTLPGHDMDIVIGKYLAVLGIYTVATIFSLSHVIILAWLGAPDLGLMLVTYLGYWLTGAALLAVGMIGSILTANATVAFILGALLCGLLIFVDRVETILGGWLSAFVHGLGITPHFQPFGDGLIEATSVFYFVALTGVMLYVNVLLVGRRHVRGSEGAGWLTMHLLVRAACLAIMAGSVFVLLGQTRAAADGTAENLHTLQPQTVALIEAIPEDRPVFIQAFFSPEVPESLVQTRKDLLNLLHRFDGVGAERIELVVHETEPFTQVATEAAANYDIGPRKIVDVQASQRSAVDVFLGLVFTSGPEEFVIPFFERGLPVEYELARSVRVVSQSARRTLGVVGTDAKIFGGFDFQTMSRSPDWSFVRELRKQYDVQQIAPAGPYPDDLDALLVVMPSSMTQPELDALRGAILAGMPTILFDDPLPLFNPALSPGLPKDAGRNPFTSQGQPPAPPKGDFGGLLAALGLAWNPSAIVWSGANPHPGIADAAPEIVFLVESADNERPFDPDSVIASGLQEVVAVYPGAARLGPAPAGSTLEHTPLLVTGTVSGDTDWASLVRNDFFGMQLNPNPRRYQTPDRYVLALHVTGAVAGDAGAPPADADTPAESPARPVSVVLITDADLVSETFFSLRRQGFAEFNFDNVTFALNCIDTLAGDESFVELRKHRPRHRSLTRVESLNEVYAERRRAETDAAEALAAEQLVKAQERLDQKVAELEGRDDLDQQTKGIMLRKLQDVESRRLEVVKSNIEQEKERSIAKARAEMNAAVAGIQRNIKWRAVIPPAIPTLVLALVLFAYRHRRERIGMPERQLVGSSLMNRIAHTGLYVGGAVVLAAAAWLSAPSPRPLEQFSDQGEPFYPEFTDALAAASLEVIDYDDTSGTAQPFKVELRDGRWTIPSHYDYPADGEDRLARTAASVIDLRKDVVQSDRVQDHELLGVLDPLDDSTASLVGRGSRVTLRDGGGAVLSDFIIGKAVEGKEGFRYVRLPEKKRVYAVKMDVDLSTRFEDWIDTNLLEVTTTDISDLVVNDYSIDETTGTVNLVGDVHLRRPADGAWTLENAPEGRVVDEDAVQAMVAALPGIAITGVRPKPDSLTSDLRTREGIAMDPVTQLSLQSKGFFVSRDGRLLSNEGEVQVGSTVGVRYTLRFGEVFYGDGLSVSAGGEDGADGDEEAAPGSENRYLFVTAVFDETLLPPPPAPPEEAGSTSGATGATSRAGGGEVALGAFQDEASPPDDPPPGDAPPSAGDEASEAAREALAEYERRREAWEECAQAGRDTARRLNDRFAAWYYVISGEDFRKIRLDLEKLTKPAEVGEPETGS